MDECVNCDPSKCDLVCLKKPKKFVRDVVEVGGFGFNDIPVLTTPARAFEPPKYIPVIQHGSSRNETATLSGWAAVPLRELFRGKGANYHPIVRTASELRNHLRLDPFTRMILLGTGKDKPIEDYWRWRQVHSLPQLLANLGFECGIVPNYSFFLREPRPHHFFNRKRSLICTREWSAAGLPSIPYLQAITQADWIFWERFLKAHPEVHVVAKEFQTGYANPTQGENALDTLSQLQDVIGRRLHVIGIGAGKYRHVLQKRFDHWTILDSVPFMKAVNWQLAGTARTRVQWHSAPGEPVEDLLETNVAKYTRWIIESGTH